jgi:hypothetical protein
MLFEHQELLLFHIGGDSIHRVSPLDQNLDCELYLLVNDGEYAQAIRRDAVYK